MKRRKEKPTRLGPGGLRENKRQGNLLTNYTDNSVSCQSAAAQRQRILAWLQCSPLSTLDARAIGIRHPGMRICELRKQGYPISTEWVSEYCAGNVRHRIARYSLEEQEENR